MNKVFAVFDSKAAAYGRIVEAPTEGLAARTFSDACGDQAGPLYQHADDYALYLLGEYDPNSGKITSLPEPKWIISASAVKAAIMVRSPELPNMPEASTKTDTADLGKTKEHELV